MPNAEDTGQGAALGREVERVTRRLDQVEHWLREVSGEVSSLREALTAAEAQPAAVRAWLLADDFVQAQEDLADLIDWLGQVYLRYPDSGLVSCWAWHPAVVEELWWLRCAHHEAYDGPHASYAKAADWHDRQRPAVVSRARHWLRDCDLARHDQPSPPARTVPLADSAARIAESWAGARRQPHPTAAELAAAEAYDRAQHRRQHR